MSRSSTKAFNALLKTLEEPPEHVKFMFATTEPEKVLPTINADKLHEGKIKVDEITSDRVDLRALLAAVREAQDNEYVTVDSRHETVRVAKQNGFVIIKVQEQGEESKKAPHEGKRQHASEVDIKIPFPVVEALLSGDKDEINVLAGIRALDKFQDLDLVTVNDEDSSVRIWVDSKNTAE
jgi:hypothetical protein